MNNFIYFNRETIIKFYRSLKNVDFSTISEERRIELDAIVNRYQYYFKNKCAGRLILSYITAEKLITSSKLFGLSTDSEKLYFYINMVDPELLFLEAYECANKKADIKNYCYANFYYYDGYIIYFEKLYNERFRDYTPDELWARELIKRSENRN